MGIEIADAAANKRAALDNQRSSHHSNSMVKRRRRVTNQTRDDDKDNDSSNSTDNGDCILCMDSKANVAFGPCGHVCICQNCNTGTKLQQMNYECPICRSHIARTQSLFFI